MVLNIIKMSEKILMSCRFGVEKDSYFWNAFSTVMNSFQTVIILLVITHSGNVEHSSIFVIAYAVGILMFNIGKYGVRQFQVTDVSEKYKFEDYLNARIVSCIWMLLFSICYVGYNIIYNGYSIEKTAVVFLICILKLVDAFEDVLHGRMQQKGRLDVATKILGIRLFVYILGYCILYILTKNLVITTGINLLVTIIIVIIFNFSVREHFGIRKSGCKSSTRYILKECFPLCICQCLNMYIGNSPKYIIDTVVSDEVQTNFNIVFMPVFVVTMLSNFIFQPLLKTIGEYWNSNNMRGLVTLTLKIVTLVIAIDISITIVAAWYGIPILGWIYNVKLNKYKFELLVFIIAGGVIALMNLMLMLITTMRYQKYVNYGYVFIAIILVSMGKRILITMGLEGLCIFFLIMMVLLTLYCVGLVAVAINKVCTSCG